MNVDWDVIQEGGHGQVDVVASQERDPRRQVGVTESLVARELIEEEPHISDGNGLLISF